MCVVSMVDDHYNKTIPQFWYGHEPVQPFQLVTHEINVESIKKMIEEYYSDRKMAEHIDEVTGQPDCEDPEKKKLLDRIAELEALLKNLPEFVIVKFTELEPATYKVIEGKLHKVIE